MRHIELTALAISIMLNLYYIFHAIPEKIQIANFWKRQCEIWRQNYLKFIEDEKIQIEEGRKRVFSPGPPPENGEGSDITG